MASFRIPAAPATGAEATARRLQAAQTNQRGSLTRAAGRGCPGLIGATAPVLRLRLPPQQPRRLLGIPFRLRELYISVEDPAGVRAALEARSGTGG